MKALLLCLAACGFPRPATDADVAIDADDSPRITSFVLPMGVNANFLVHDAVGAIGKDAIAVTVFGLATLSSPPSFVAMVTATPDTTVMLGGTPISDGSFTIAIGQPLELDAVRGDRTTHYTALVTDREATPTSGPATTGTLQQVVAGDLDANGSDDFVVLVAPTTVTAQAWTYLVTDGTVKASAQVALTPHTDHIALADLNMDGKLDLIAHVPKVNLNQPALAIGRGDGIGGFDAGKVVDCANGFDEFAVGDVDNDGLPDLVVATLSQVMFCPNLGPNADYAFGFAQTIGTEGCNTNSVEVADVDGDGRPEVIVGCNNKMNMIIYKHTTAWSPRDVDTQSVSAGPVAPATLYGGVPGLVVGNQSNGGISTHTFGGEADASIVVGANTLAFGVADFDGDGYADIAVPSTSTPLWLGVPNAAGMAPTFARAPGAKPPSALPISIAIGDFNGDHIPDFVSITSVAIQLTIVK